MKDFTPAINAYRLLFSLTETSTSHPRDSATHSPFLPYPPTEHYRPLEEKREKTISVGNNRGPHRVDLFPRSTSRNVVQCTNRGTTLRDRESLGGRRGGQR